MPQTITDKQFVELLKPGQTVYIQNGCTQPTALVEALKDNPHCAEKVKFISMVNRLNPHNFTTLHSTTEQETFFMSGFLRKGYDPQRLHILPFHLSEIYSYLADVADIDIACVQVSPADNRGQHSFAMTGDYVPAVNRRAKIVVAEVNPSLLVCSGAPTIGSEEIDYYVESDHELLIWTSRPPKDELAALGRNVASLVDDGDTIQMGVGTASDAVLAALTDHRDLGIHTGLVPDNLVDMIEAGAITGAKKSIDKGRIITGSAMGTERLYDFIANSDIVDFKPVSYTHDVNILSQIDNFRVVNSAVEVDLFCQVNCEYMGGQQIAGIGGQLDFVRGAKRAKNGISILALQASTRKGEVSRIVSRIPQNALVSVPRSDADFIVTEHGIADLRFASVNQRAERLIAIAAPQFRDQLANDWDAACRVVAGQS
jgi:4-hydroxybutyrate CoA-transferase